MNTDTEDANHELETHTLVAKGPTYSLSSFSLLKDKMSRLPTSISKFKPFIQLTIAFVFLRSDSKRELLQTSGTFFYILKVVLLLEMADALYSSNSDIYQPWYVV